MPDLSAFRLLTGVVALIAVACGASSTAPAEAPGSVAQPSARPESTPTWVPPTRHRLAPDPLFDPTPTPRLAVVLRDIQGLSTEESAEALDISIVSLKSRLHRARILLRKPWNRIRRYRCCPIRRPWPILSKTP
ncbi:MAG: hypothetical protein COB86_08485 [Dehalococcoidia bacterium]|nr:MAG: hypothetical protein COB86_08485 [Dehalococcoidia bacterium]